MSGQESPGPIGSDAALVARIAAGDERALAALYDAYGGVAFGLATAMTPDRSAAEAVVADAFARVWREARTFDSARLSVVAWITTLVRQRAVAELRSSSARGSARRQATWGGGQPGGANLPESTVSGRAPMSQALSRLRDNQRRAVELAYLGGLTIVEIARELGEPEGSVRELLRSGMDELRSALSTGASFEEQVATRV